MPCVPRMAAEDMLATENAATSQESTSPGAQSQEPSQSTTNEDDAQPPRRSVRRRGPPAADDRPEAARLYFPHELSLEDLEGCVAGLAENESLLRDGQMRSALDHLRVQLHVRSRLITFKARNSRHQRQNQKSREKIDKCEAKIKLLTAKYRSARAAKLALCGPGDWEKEWRPLTDRDVRGLSDPEPQVDQNNEPLSRRQITTEGRRVLSWIWLSADWDEESEAAAVGGITEGMSTVKSEAAPANISYQLSVTNGCELARGPCDTRRRYCM